MTTRRTGPVQTRDSVDDALHRLRVAIKQHDRGTTDIDDLRGALTAVCTQARRECMTPERLLVAVKTALDEFPVTDGYPPDRTAIKQRIVSLAIRSYYAEEDSDAQDRH